MIRCYVTPIGLNEQAPPRLRNLIERHTTNGRHKVLGRRVRIGFLHPGCPATIDLGSQYGGHWLAKYFTYKRKEAQ